MIENFVVQRVQDWFAANCSQLSMDFPILHFRVFRAADSMLGKVVIEVEAEQGGLSVTCWNKGEVMALIVDATTKETNSLDDRRLEATDDLNSLLYLYFERFRNMAGRDGIGIPK